MFAFEIYVNSYILVGENFFFMFFILSTSPEDASQRGETHVEDSFGGGVGGSCQCNCVGVNYFMRREDGKIY